MKKIGIVAGLGSRPLRNYRDAVRGSGAEAVTLQPETFLPMLPQLDGILLPGGSDLNPALYGEENTASEGVDDALDRFELDVLDAALARQLPVLGICRGHQLLNVYFGGTLLQDVDRQVHTKDGPADRIHGSRVEKSSYLYRLYGRERLVINSSHHQAIHRLAPVLEPIQYSDDGLIEAVVHKTLPVFGVQWHPERTCLAFARPDIADGLAVFRHFLEQG